MKMLFTFGSALRISKAFFTVSGVAPLCGRISPTESAVKRNHAPSNVKEVSGLSTVKAKHVHRSHSEPCTVDESANISIKLDEVQVIFLCFNFGRLLLRDVTKGVDILLTEGSIVIEAEFSIHAGTFSVYNEREAIKKNKP